MRLTQDVIDSRYDNAGPFQWVDPRNIEGIDATQFKRLNKRRWFKLDGLDANSEPPELAVVSYLQLCIRLGSHADENGVVYLSENEVTPDMMLDAVAYIIDAWGSSYTATMFGRSRSLISEDSAERSLDLLLNKYDEAEPFVQDLFRDFILGLYRNEFVSDWTGGWFFDSIREDQKTAVKRLFDNGYVTINNENCRYFSDGRRRY